jgi:formylmethanofuran dehydrogenase subunit D
LRQIPAAGRVLRRNEADNSMIETMLLIPGRTSRQGTSLNKGKLEAEYQDETTTVEMNEGDMARLGLQDGDRVLLSNPVGSVAVTCRPRKDKDLPSGLLFMAYGPGSSQLMESDTAGSGMPLSKHIEVSVTRMPAAAPAREQAASS